MPVLVVRPASAWLKDRRRLYGIPAAHAELDPLGIEPAAFRAPDLDGRPARDLAVPGRFGAPRARDDADEQEDPPEPDHPSADAGEDAADDEQDDGSEERLEERHDGEGRAHRGANRAHEEAEECVEDDHDAHDREERPDEEHGHGAPPERQRRRGPRGARRSVRVRHRGLDLTGRWAVGNGVAVPPDKSFRGVPTGGTHGYPMSAAATTVSANKTPFVVLRRSASSCTRPASPSTIRTSRQVSSFKCVWAVARIDPRKSCCRCRMRWVTMPTSCR